MKKFFCLFLIFVPFCFGQSELAQKLIEPDMVYLPQSEQPGGYYMPSIAENGQYVRILIVFVQFKDDNWNINWSDWPKNQAPTAWMNNSFVDQTVNQNSNNGNLTHYFTTMSMNHYKVIGDFKHFITSKTRDEYIQLNMKRGQINREILQEISGVDWSLYDKWIKTAAHTFSWGSDGEVDMIWMIYRNIGEDRPNPAYTAYQLDFGDYYSGTYRKWSGEASLGGGGILNVSGGKTIDLGWFGLVSGLSIMTGYQGIGSVKGVCIHEFGHHLLGGMEMHLQTGSWGIMSGYGSRSQVVNPYERQKLGWINLMQYDYNPILPIPLGDYLTTGNALRIKIPGTTNQYYLAANHQRVSVFDNMDLTSNGKGVYVLYQNGTNNLNLYFYNAEGRALWTFDHYAVHPTVGVTVPVFRKGLQNNSSGRFDTESIPYGTNSQAPIEAYINPTTGQDIFAPLFKGDSKDMMRPGYLEVFSPWSNPSLTSVAFQVISENNQIKIIQKVESSTQVSLSPSKPQNLKVTWYNNHPKLTWETNTETDMQSYKIWKYAAGSSMIAATITYNASYTTHSWTDNNVTLPGKFDPQIEYKYKIIAVDNTNKESVYSDQVSIIGNGDLWKEGEGETENDYAVTEYQLFNNYPNPFNPTTTIHYDVKEKGLVSLTVYDLLGSEVVSLVNESKDEGSYTVNFDASNLPSGVYIYTLRVNDFTASKKMVVLK